MSEPVLSRRARRLFALANAVSAILLALLGFVAVRTRFWLVDLPLGAVVLLLAASAVALLARAHGAERLLRVAAWAAFGFGLALVALMLLTIAFLRGVYGESGSVAMATCALIVALVIPYLVLMPAVELCWLGRGRDGAP